MLKKIPIKNYIYLKDDASGVQGDIEQAIVYKMFKIH